MTALTVALRDEQYEIVTLRLMLRLMLTLRETAPPHARNWSRCSRRSIVSDAPRRSFYARVISTADLQAARNMDGLDDEVALLRVQIRQLLLEEEPDARVIQGAMRMLVQTLTAQHRLSGQQAEGLRDAAAQLLEEFGAALASPVANIS